MYATAKLSWSTSHLNPSDSGLIEAASQDIQCIFPRTHYTEKAWILSCKTTPYKCWRPALHKALRTEEILRQSNTFSFGKGWFISAAVKWLHCWINLRPRLSPLTGWWWGEKFAHYSALSTVKRISVAIFLWFCKLYFSYYITISIWFTCTAHTLNCSVHKSRGCSADINVQRHQLNV